MDVTSEALGTCERLAQGRYSAMRRPGGVPVHDLLIASPALTTTLPNHMSIIHTHAPLTPSSIIWYWQTALMFCT